MYINGQTELIISFFCENNSESLSIKTIHKILDQPKKKKSNITTLLSPIPTFLQFLHISNNYKYQITREITNIKIKYLS